KDFDKDGVMVDLGQDEAAREPIPGLAQTLIGLPLGATDHEVRFKVADVEGVRKELVGQSAELKVTIREAREKQTPAIDDEFAKDTGEADTLDELKGKLREKLLEEDRKAAREEVKRDLIKELLKRNEFQVAPALVERQ